MHTMRIKGYEDSYTIDSNGTVVSLNYRRTGKPHVLKPIKDSQGYLKVSLSKNGKLTQFFVHRLVAEHFIDNPSGLPQVNHKDENKENNSVENLEWCTASYNVNYGTRNYKDKLKQGKKVLCIETGEEFLSIREAAKQYNIDRSDLSKCCRGIKRIVGGYHWEFKEGKE